MFLYLILQIFIEKTTALSVRSMSQVKYFLNVNKVEINMFLYLILQIFIEKTTALSVRSMFLYLILQIFIKKTAVLSILFYPGKVLKNRRKHIYTGLPVFLRPVGS